MLVKIEREEGVAIVTLNRPEAMNALSSGLCTELAEAFRALDRADDVRVVILTGAGDRAFTAGLDLKELGNDAGLLGVAEGDDGTSGPAKAIAGCRKPVIGAINGVAITGGFELALCCDILIASEKARFADTHARVGLMPGWGLSQRLSRLIGISRAKELSFSGNFLDARTACEWGLVNRVYAPEELMPAARKLAADIASAQSDKVETYKKLIDDGFAQNFGEALEIEHRVSTEANRQIDARDVEASRMAVIERGRSQA